MAIEKMALVQIEGALKKVNKTLMKCCESNCFHMISSSHNSSGEKSGFRTLKDKNVYAPLVKRAKALADGLGIKLVPAEYDDVEYNVSIDFAGYLEKIEKEYGALFEEKQRLDAQLEQHSKTLVQVEQLAGLNVNFADLYACKYVKVRFGRLPVDSVPKMEYFSDHTFYFYQFENDGDYVWGLYLVPASQSVEIDDMFNSIYFERVRMPDYLHGTADESKMEILRLVKQESEQLDEIKAKLDELSKREKDKFIRVFNKLKAISDSYELRTNVSVINNRFFVSGFVPEREKKRFTELLGDIDGIEISFKPADSDPSATPPVKLRNNVVFRPFEMFVKMYGLPSYGGMDPTPYVAVTYMLMYGIMFGDLGQGLVIALLGFILTKWKNVKLGPIMVRIGLSGAVFGTLYGSVFGNEELIEPFFKIEPIYKTLGFTTAPKDIFQISSYLLIATLVIGAFLILISMAFNIRLSLKKGNVEQGILGSNGIVGMIFYMAVLAGAALQLGFGIQMFTPAYVGCLIILPLVIMFFKEPVSHSISSKIKGTKSKRNAALLRAVKTYSDSITEVESVSGNHTTLEELVKCEYIKARYGRLPVKSYEKLENYSELDFVFYPFESDDDAVMGVYIAPKVSSAVVDRAFEQLGFERMKMPEHIEDIRKDKRLHLPEEAAPKKKKSVGNFIIEGVIELFESCLTYITNTMSFLRIGGFVLSHAGMMLVVNVLATQAGGGSIIVEILGNAFVIGLEGFLVGIQVLRLEFYEVFSRFYTGDGKPFKPIMVNFDLEN